MIKHPLLSAVISNLSLTTSVPTSTFKRYQYTQEALPQSTELPLQPYPTWLIVFLWLLTCLFCVETTLGNLLVLCAYKLERNIRKHLSNKFIVSLAVSDLIIGMEGFPLLTVYVVEREQWPLGRLLCQMWLCVDYTLCLVSIVTVLLITVDRYCSVCYPASYRVWQTRRKIHIMIVLSWLIPFALFALMIFGWNAISISTDNNITASDNVTRSVVQQTTDSHKCSAPFLDDPYVNMSMYIAYYWTTLAAMSVLYRGIHKAAKTLEMKSKAREKNTLALIFGQRCMAQVGVGILMQTDEFEGEEENRKNFEEESLFHRHPGQDSETIENHSENHKIQIDNSESSENCPDQLINSPLPPKLLANRTLSARLFNSSRYSVFRTPPPGKRQIKSYCSLDLCDNGSLCMSDDHDHREKKQILFKKALTVTCDDYGNVVNTKCCLNANCNKNYGACVSSSMVTVGQKKMAQPNRHKLSVSYQEDTDSSDMRRLSSSSTTPDSLNRVLNNSSLFDYNKRRLSEHALDDGDKKSALTDNATDTDKPYHFRQNYSEHRICKETLHTVLQKHDEQQQLVISDSDKKDEEEEDDEEEEEESGGSADEADKDDKADKPSADGRSSKNNNALSVTDSATDNASPNPGPKRSWLTTLFTSPAWLLSKKRRVSKAEKRARKAFRTITVIVGTFALFWSPYFIVATIYGFRPQWVPPPLFFTSYYLCYLNSSVNPFAYAFANRLFRKTFVRILRGDFRRK